MSLVNNVLRDLDRRRAADSERGAIPNEVRPLPGEARAAVHPYVVVAGVLAIALIAFAWWWIRAEEAAPSSAQLPQAMAPAIVAARPADTPPATQSAPAAPASPVAMAPMLLPAPAAPPASPVEQTSDAASAKDASPKQAAREIADIGKAKPANAPRATTDSAIPGTPPGRLKLAGELALRSPPTRPQTPPQSPPPRATEPIVPPLPPMPAREDDWNQAQTLLRDGRPEMAEPMLKRILLAQPGHVQVRNALVGILLPAKRNAEALDVLKDGLALRPGESGWAINLARLHAMGNDYPAAWEVLERSLPHAETNAEYRAFSGTVLQRLNRGGEAIAHYQAALKLNPREPRWWVGIGIAFESAARMPEAREAYGRAQGLGGLPPELATFVAQKLK